jgi:hypothetical protein
MVTAKLQAPASVIWVISAFEDGGELSLFRNGTMLQPIEEGFLPEHPSRQGTLAKQEEKNSKRTGGSTMPHLSKRNCEFTQEGATYTFPSNTRVIEGTYR